MLSLVQICMKINMWNNNNISHNNNNDHVNKENLLTAKYVAATKQRLLHLLGLTKSTSCYHTQTQTRTHTFNGAYVKAHNEIFNLTLVSQLSTHTHTCALGKIYFLTCNQTIQKLIFFLVLHFGMFCQELGGSQKKTNGNFCNCGLKSYRQWMPMQMYWDLHYATQTLVWEAWVAVCCCMVTKIENYFYQTNGGCNNISLRNYVRKCEFVWVCVFKLSRPPC